MDATHPAAWPARRLLAECDVRRLRRSGPGGQHRNKVETAVVLTHRPSGIVAQASERRTQEENRQQALFRLRLRLAVELRWPVSSDDPASPLWLSRLMGQRIQVSDSHDDFPTLLAEALDRLEAAEYDVVAAAQALGVSSSQLVRLLRRLPAAIERVNGQRRERGLRTLH